MRSDGCRLCWWLTTRTPPLTGSSGRSCGQVSRCRCRCPTSDSWAGPLVGPARLALAKAESLLPRTVIEPAEQALRSSGAFIGLLRKVQGLNSNLFRG